MIDIHSHLIPSVDDGARTVDETFELIKEAQNAGFSDIILTPHYMLDAYEPNAKELILWKEKLQEILNKEEIAVNLHIGMEVYIAEDIINLIKQNKILTLAESKYLLMELPLNTNVKYLDDVIFKLLENNITPIIAHPERYKCVQEQPNIVEKLIEKECLIQSNYGSILGIYGKKAQKTVKYLLKKNLIDFLGTDTHRKNTIYLEIEKASKKIKKLIGEEKLKELTTTNAKRILENK